MDFWWPSYRCQAHDVLDNDKVLSKYIWWLYNFIVEDQRTSDALQLVWERWKTYTFSKCDTVVLCAKSDWWNDWDRTTKGRYSLKWIQQFWLTFLSRECDSLALFAFLKPKILLNQSFSQLRYRYREIIYSTRVMCYANYLLSPNSSSSLVQRCGISQTKMFYTNVTSFIFESTDLQKKT